MSDSYQCIKKEIHMKKLVAVLTLVLALMMAMTAFASQDTITIGVANDITTLDPQAKLFRALRTPGKSVKTEKLSPSTFPPA